MTPCVSGLGFELGAGRVEEGDGGTHGHGTAVEFLSQDEACGRAGDEVIYADAARAAGLGCVLGKRRGQDGGKRTVVGAGGLGLSGTYPDGNEEEDVHTMQRKIGDLHGRWGE